METQDVECADKVQLTEVGNPHNAGHASWLVESPAEVHKKRWARSLSAERGLEETERAQQKKAERVERASTSSGRE